jgi:hypothetical protein
MPKSIEALAQTIQAMRPMLPAKDFARSVKFYVDLGFQQRTLTDGLAEMTLGACSFLLQDYYVREWADNLVIHLFVSDLDSWWAHIVALDLPSRYGEHDGRGKSPDDDDCKATFYERARGRRRCRPDPRSTGGGCGGGPRNDDRSLAETWSLRFHALRRRGTAARRGFYRYPLCR